MFIFQISVLSCEECDIYIYQIDDDNFDGSDDKNNSS